MKVVTHVNRATVAELKHFTDRVEARKVFADLLSKGENSDDEFFVLSCYGIPGSGKSRLLQEYKTILEKERSRKYVYASYDFENSSADPFQVTTRLARQLEKKGLAFPLTLAAELAYNQKSGVPVFQEAEEQTIIDHPIFSILGAFLPQVDQVLSAIQTSKDIYQVLTGYKEKLQRLWNPKARELEKELERLFEINDPGIIRQFMPDYFRMDLQRNAENFEKLKVKSPLVLFLDTYENAAGYEMGDLWLRKDIICQVPGILWVIAGREKLGWKEKDDVFADMKECSLEDFSETDSDVYLTQAGIPASLRPHMIQISNGSPLFLDICVDSYYEQYQPGKMIYPEDIGVDKESLISIFVKRMTKDDQEIAVALALLDKWSEEDAESILPVALGAGFRMGDYEAFLQHSIIRKDKEERYYIHQVVREVLLTYAGEPRFADIVKAIRSKQAEKYSLQQNAPLSEALAAMKDLEDLKKQNIETEELLAEAARKNQEVYARFAEIKGGGWGPERQMFTMKSPSPWPVLNSIQDNPSLGDERSFVRIRRKGSKEHYIHKARLYPFETYEVFVYFDNSCTAKDKGTITGATAQVFCPLEIQPFTIGKISALLSADNTNPLEIWSNAFIYADIPLRIEYLKESAVIVSTQEKSEKGLSSRLFRKGGALIGTQKNDGIISPDQSGYIHFEFRTMPLTEWGPVRKLYTEGKDAEYVAFNSRINGMRWGDERYFTGIRRLDEKEYHREMTLTDNTEYEVRIFYDNNCEPDLNKTGVGIADSVRIMASVPQDQITPDHDQKLFAGLYCMEKGYIWSCVTLHVSDIPLHVEFVDASAVIHNGGRTNGTILSTDLLSSGQYIGVNVMDGRIPAGVPYSGWITFRIRAKSTRFRISRTTSLDGKHFMDGIVEAHPGDRITFRTEFINLGSSILTNVGFHDVLPEGINYVDGTTVLYNGSHRDGLKMKDLIHRNGFNTGEYWPRANAIILYEVQVVEDAAGDYLTKSFCDCNQGEVVSGVTIRVI